MKKLAIIADPLDNQRAGVHVYTREMVHSLIRFNPGWEIILIRQKRDEKLYGVRQIVVKNISLPIGFASFRLFFLIPYLLRKEKVDVVIEPAHFGPFNLPKNIKRITVVHDLTPLIFPHFHRFHSQLLQRIFLKRILKKADLIISNSDHTKKDIISFFPFTKDKIIKIYPGIRLNDIDSSPTTNIPYFITSPYFLTVGTIEPRKNHLLILQAFEIFKKLDKADTKLIICGSRGWKSKSFFDALQNSSVKSHVHLTGYAKDSILINLYKFSIAMIYPSKYEGFGLPVAEAILAGTIPIVNQSSSLPEVAGPDAFYIRKEESHELALAMKKVFDLSPKERTLKISSQKNHIIQFSWDEFGKKLWDEMINLKS